MSLASSKNLLTAEKTKQKYIHDFFGAKSFDKEMLKTLINKIEIKEDKTVKIFFNFNLNGAINVS